MDRVLAVWDLYDGPRTGIAEYRGNPHYFFCGWDPAADDYSNIFDLSPIDEPTLKLALEQWTIWRSWESDYHAGRVAQDTHPGFGGINLRYDELDLLLKAAVAALPLPSIQAIPQFNPDLDDSDLSAGVMRPLLVVWSNVA